MNSTKTEVASERKKTRQKIATYQGELQKEINKVRKLKSRLKRTFKAFFLAFERCERIDKMLNEMIASYGKKDAHTPNGQKKGE